MNNKGDTLFSVTAITDYFGTSGKGNIVLKSYSNAYQILIIGVVSENKNEAEQKMFFNSLKF